MDQAQGAIDAARAAGAEFTRPPNIRPPPRRSNKPMTPSRSATTGSRSTTHSRAASRHRMPHGRRPIPAKLRGDVERSIAEAKASSPRLTHAWKVRPQRRSPQRPPQRTTTSETAGRRPAKSGRGASSRDGSGPPIDGVKQQIQSIITTLSRGSSSQSPRRQT